MKRYIAFFDFLGFTQFILNYDDIEEVKRRLSHLFRDIEHATTDHRLLSEKSHNIIPDIDTINVSCLNFSDTVIYYSDDDSDESLQHILKVAYKLNWVCNLHNFPLRGIVVLEELEMESNSVVNRAGRKVFQTAMLYGKGMALAHIKCEEQQWAGCCIDNGVIETVKSGNAKKLLNDLAIRYNIPVKSSKLSIFSNYAFRLYVGGANDIALSNLKKDIYETFVRDNKEIEDENTRQKYENTIAFIEYLQDK